MNGEAAHQRDRVPEASPSLDAGQLADLWLGALDAEGAAKFLGYSADAFKRAAPTMPRYPGPNGSYRYLRSDLISWLKGRSSGSKVDTPISVPDPAPSRRRTGDRSRTPVKRLHE